ncbi:YdiU family protein [bacterium]|nr:YdiU family protein [bacterium]
MNACGFNFDTTYFTLPDQFYTKLPPEPVRSPHLVILNEALANVMGLDFSELRTAEQAALFSGNELAEGATPFSQAYAGHQFGHFTILGDGRAHLWGEHVTPGRERFDIQFKGSGRTPYSRNGDGRAVLGPMLREYVISEAMHALAVPTTRSLAVVSTGEEVMRETVLPGAILTRVASSHLRVGTFEFAALQGGEDAVSSLMDYTIHRHYPELAGREERAVALIQAVMERQAELIVHWMRVGFIHGVMNTDNMTLSGETIDYGPCAFMDTYDPSTVFSSIDHAGRYAYGNQPKIAQWNLARLAEALLPCIDDDQERAVSIAQEVIDQFSDMFQQKWRAMMCSKLGLSETVSGDKQLIGDLLRWMETNHADYTNTFRDLSKQEKPTEKLYSQSSFEDWYARWQKRREQNSEPRSSSILRMKKANPALIPRNHKVEEALNAAHKGNLAPFQDLLGALKDPYEDPAEFLEGYQIPPNPSERVQQTFCGT